GARPLRRTIQRELEDSLSEKILYGELRPGQVVKVTVDDLGLVFTSESALAPMDDADSGETAAAGGETGNSCTAHLFT
ncbi:hypothetical protein, partial [Nonomuraea sp. NPDC050202]|uniref:hypothetical protein n=1 Tax=Nonomuraea sp. NPDC050202 TaxID=3155035 RepID=UPI0033C21F2C